MSYISSLNLLNTDSPAPPSEDTFSDDLALWANAQFTFDSAPGSALLEDDKKEENEKLFASLTDFTIEDQQQQEQQKLDEPSNYLSSDYLLSQLQQLAPTSTTPAKLTHMGLPRLAPAPTEQQLHHQLQNHQNERYLNSMTMPNTNAITKEKGNRSNKRSMNDDGQDQPPRNTAASAVEDDKRRRNTAASARFRQKKKLREQALEQTAKEMSNKCETLDKRVRELELEAKWLRALVVEKNPSLLADRNESSESDGKSDDSVATAKSS